MKIATWNVNGIRARQGQLLEWLAAEKPDIVCLQEIKASPDQVPVWLAALDGYWTHWHGDKGYSGVALLVQVSTDNRNRSSSDVRSTFSKNTYLGRPWSRPSALARTGSKSTNHDLNRACAMASRVALVSRRRVMRSSRLPNIAAISR